MKNVTTDTTHEILSYANRIIHLITRFASAIISKGVSVITVAQLVFNFYGYKFWPQIKNMATISSNTFIGSFINVFY